MFCIKEILRYLLLIHIQWWRDKRKFHSHGRVPKQKLSIKKNDIDKENFPWIFTERGTGMTCHFYLNKLPTNVVGESKIVSKTEYT